MLMVHGTWPRLSGVSVHSYKRRSNVNEEVRNSRSKIPKGAGGRWNKPNPRYTVSEQNVNDKVLREGKDWHNGAKVYKK